MIVNENKIMNTKQKLSYVKLRELLRKSSPSLEESILINNTLREDPEILMGFESTFLQINILRQLFNVADSLGINNFKVINRFVASLKKQKATTLRLIKTDLNNDVLNRLNEFLVGRVSDENKDINTTKLPQVNQFDFDRIDQFCVVWDNLWMIESIKPIINPVDWEEAPNESLMVDALKARLNPLVNPPTFKSYLLFEKIPSIGSLYSDIEIHPWDSIDLFDKQVESGNRSDTTCFSGEYQPYLMSQKHWGYKHYSNEVSILEPEQSNVFWKNTQNLNVFSATKSNLLRIVSPPSETFDLIQKLKKFDIKYFIDWGGNLVWLEINKVSPKILREITDIVRSAKGYLTVIKIEEHLKAQIDIFAIDSIKYKITEKIKKSFDPRRILNPGKMYIGI